MISMTKICKTISYSVFIFLLMGFAHQTAFCKTSPKISKLAKLNKPDDHSNNYKSYLKKSHNELEATAAILFIGYKSFLSSQDMNSCVFTPSCSVYAIESLQHNNPFKAYLKIFDRLSRCHPLSAKNEYQYNYQTQKYYDPAY
jgi:putative membrane protein insertion efficiency factor